MHRSRHWFWFLAPAIGASAGLLYWLVFGIGPAAGSVLRGAVIGTPILLYERGFLLPRWRDRIRRLATPLFAAATLAIYAGTIVLGNAVAGLILFSGLGYMRDARAAMLMTDTGFAYALGVSAAVLFVFRVRDLIGPSVFNNFLIGRYHRPISEERVFLFLDVAGSTRFADRHGDLAAQAYLGRIFDALALPVSRARGSIDDYIGDLAVITWPVARGVRDAACLACVFDILDTVAAEAASWEAAFGQVPAFRAALHCGPVVTAEVGLERHKIAYFGDAVNTTARLEALSKTLGAPVLASADLLARMDPLPAGFTVEDLGSHEIRGRHEPLRVAAIGRRAGAVRVGQRVKVRAAGLGGAVPALSARVAVGWFRMGAGDPRPERAAPPHPAPRRPVSQVASSTARVTSATSSVEAALISGFTPSRIWL